MDITERLQPEDICSAEPDDNGHGWAVVLYTPDGNRHEIARGLTRDDATDRSVVVAESALAWMQEN